MTSFLYKLCCTALIYIYIGLKKTDGSLLQLRNYYIFHKPCDSSQSFSVVFGESLEKCLKVCQHQSHCEVLMISHRMKLCALFDESVTNKTFEKSNPLCMYIKVDKTSGNGSLTQAPQCSPLEKFDSLTKRCEYERCSNPTIIKNAILLFTSTSIGKSARYKCNAGFFGKGNPRIVCQPNVTWSITTFSCMSTTCPEPKLVENAYPLASKPTKIGSTVKYNCTSGFYSLGLPEIYCNLNATWATPGFTCTDKKCPQEMDIAGAFVYSTGRYIGSESHYECEQGFLSSGDPYIQCLVNTSWSLTNFACEKLCPHPTPVVNAHLEAVEYTDGGMFLREGTWLTYSCNVDYYGESNTAINICDRGGTWNPERVVCCKNGTVSDGQKCFRAFSMHSGINFLDVQGICASYDLDFASTTEKLYNLLVDRGYSLAQKMLYRRTKGELQADLYIQCLSIHMNETELQEYESATYEDTMHVIKANGWDDIEETDTKNYCKTFLVNEWLVGEPNGGDAHQCIVTGPMTSFKYDDIDCNNLDPETLGFVCMYSPPTVSD